MKGPTKKAFRILAALLTLGPAGALAQPSEVEQLKAAMKAMERNMEEMKQRIADLEKQKSQASATNPLSRLEQASPSIKALEKVSEGGQIGSQSPITYRGALNDQQEAATRPKDFTLDPQYRGFIPVPNTPVLIKFNAKPHLDMTSDNQNTGDKYRFVPAKFPLKGAADYGEGEQFNVNANGTQLRLDVRAPDLDGNFRFYYQNDFFGSGDSDMKYRLQHVYGQLYGFKAGFTYGVWEDPDTWPDTVDYEGPNSAIFARRPVAQYTYAWNDDWNTTFGVEKPDILVDGVASTITRMPDLGFNTRWEKGGIGHVQFSNLYRDIGGRDPAGKDHHVFGWGVNLGAGVDLSKNDSAQLLGVYGEGVGGLGNDAGFLGSDAGLTTDGHLKAMRYWSGMFGLTHRWTEQWRSTVSYGYVNLKNTSGQVGDFYHFSHYTSVNLIWQLRKRLSVGLEGLYGFKQVKDGRDSGNTFRVQLGMVYSIFD